MATYISIIISTKNNENEIENTLQPLQALRAIGHEVIVCDGGSRDHTVAMARPLCDMMLQDQRSWGDRINAGANVAHHPIFLFLHPNIRLPVDAMDQISDGLRKSRRVWGGFRITQREIGITAFLRDMESRLSDIYRADQAIFVTRSGFALAGGVPLLPILEDVAFSMALQKLGPPLRIEKPVKLLSPPISLEQFWLSFKLRQAFAKGAKPASLAKLYNLESE